MTIGRAIQTVATGNEPPRSKAPAIAIALLGAVTWAALIFTNNAVAVDFSRYGFVLTPPSQLAVQAGQMLLNFWYVVAVLQIVVIGLAVVVRHPAVSLTAATASLASAALLAVGQLYGLLLPFVQ